MSWLARSLASSFREGENEEEERSQGENPAPENESGRGMKEDLSELTRSFTKQLWGVASFLAPPPATATAVKESPAAESQISNPEGVDFRESLQLQAVDLKQGEENSSGENAQRLEGIRSDIAEIRTGISRFSSKIASNLLPFGRESDAEEEQEEEEEEDEEDEEDEEHAEDSSLFEEEKLKSAVGVTEEVLTFARNISMHPETWLDFPLFADEDDLEDFDMSDAQWEHASAIERLAPRLAALRTELCPGYMSEGRFWKIYFVLLHSRLNKQDAHLLTTPQIVEARGLLMQELQNRTKAQTGNTGNNMVASEEKSTMLFQEDSHLQLSNNPDRNERVESFKIVSLQAATPVAAKDFQFDDQTAGTSTQRGFFNDQTYSEEPKIENKAVLSGTVKLSEYKMDDDEADVDDWPEEESAGIDVPVRTSAGLENEEDVSFSDLEDEDNVTVRTASNIKESLGSSSRSTKEWVQLEKGVNYMAEGSSSYMSSNSDAHILHSRGASTVQNTEKQGSGESNDWLTVEEEDVISTDSS